MYFALSYDTLEEAVKPELKLEFENNKKQWLSWDKWSNREPGLFKLEKEGTRAIAICSKCYFGDDENSAKTKMSSKSVSQKQNMPPPKPNLSLKLKQEHNEQIWQKYERVLDGYKDIATNREVEVAKSLTKEQLAYILFKGGNTVSEGTTINSSRTKPRLGPSNK